MQGAYLGTTSYHNYPIICHMCPQVGPLCKSRQNKWTGLNDPPPKKTLIRVPCSAKTLQLVRGNHGEGKECFAEATFGGNGQASVMLGRNFDVRGAKRHYCNVHWKVYFTLEASSVAFCQAASCIDTYL